MKRKVELLYNEIEKILMIKLEIWNIRRAGRPLNELLFNHEVRQRIKPCAYRLIRVKRYARNFEVLSLRV